MIAALMAFTLAACDSSTPDSVDADDSSALFFGLWNLTGAQDDSGDLTQNLAQNYASITADFDTDSTFVFFWDASSEQAEDATLTGTFKGTESSSLLRLQTEIGGDDASLTFSYSFSILDSTEFSLTSTATQTQVMNSALGTTFSGPTTLMFTLLEQ